MSGGSYTKAGPEASDRDQLSRARISSVDSSGVLDDVLNQPSQLADALARVQAAGIEPFDARGLVVCGVGGSAIGADLAEAAIGARARRPIRIIRGYSPGPCIDADTLVVCASYSGETEETLACFELAGACGARRVAITTGGTLGDQARAEGVPVVSLPTGFHPRAAIIYMMVAAMSCAARCGAGPDLASEILGAHDLLVSAASEWGPESADSSLAKMLARQLQGTIPVIYGGELTIPLAMRFKDQINENAKTPAFCAALPEANHNELCGWVGASSLAPMFALFLIDPYTHPRLQRRIELSARYAALTASGVSCVASLGTTPVERVLSLVLLADLVTVYLAILGSTDPGPIEPIVQFKNDLG
jgi:glucose/mannose-6-phosphate isomerase